MGACNSTGSQAAHSLGLSCGRRLRNRRHQQHCNNSPSSSSSSDEQDENESNRARSGAPTNHASQKRRESQAANIKSIPIELSGESITSNLAQSEISSKQANTPADLATGHENKETQSRQKEKSKSRSPSSSTSSSSTSPSSSSQSSSKNSSSKANRPGDSAQASNETGDNNINLNQTKDDNQIQSDEAKAARLAKLKEGVDFIENEGDVEAVESAVVKIQSTFRGKKIRSKLGAGGAGAKQQEQQKEHAAANSTSTPNATTTTTTTTKAALSENKNNANLIKSEAGLKQQEESLSKKLATMQVDDKTPTQTAAAAASDGGQDKLPASSSPTANLPEDVAATKIQAGFKGYKTRKELAEEGKLATGGQAQNEQQASG